MNLQEKIEESESYLLTLTVRDKNSDENNLHHFVERKDFELDDIIPSLDHSVRLLNVVPPTKPDIIIPKKVEEKREPLKIGIVTHFNKAGDSFSPAKAVRNQAKILSSYGHEVVLFVQEGSKMELEGVEVRTIVPKFKRVKNVVNEEIKEKFIDILKKEIVGFDLMISHDLYIDDCLTYREGIKECGVDVEWLHWARSGVGAPINFDMPNARYVYMNYAEAGVFAKKIGVGEDRIRVAFNEKDPSFFFEWNNITKTISDKMELWNKDVIQTFPICTTRADAKGINSVIRVFGELKRKGKKVALIICNSNGRRRVEEIKDKLKFAEDCGLTEKDILFTSTLGEETQNEVPNKVVSELFQISNLFVMPTTAEVCSNTVLESSMCKNLLVLNEDLPCLFDFAIPDILRYPFTSRSSIHYSNKDDKSFEELSEKIISRLDNNLADKQFRYVWKNHSSVSIYKNMLEPIIYENNKIINIKEEKNMNKKDETIDIVLVSYNRPRMLEKTIESIKDRTLYPHRLIVVDNNSNDETKRILKRFEKVGKVDKVIYMEENVGQAMSQNVGLQYVKSEYFVTTQNDLLPPKFNPCWLERLKHLMEKHTEYGAICMRIQRTRRLEWEETDDIIRNLKSMPSVFRIHNTAEIRSLGENPFGNRKHWESHSCAELMRGLKKKFGMAVHIYCDHIGFMSDNKGYESDEKEYFTYSKEREKQGEDKPYPIIDPETNIPTEILHGVDREEHAKREAYWGTETGVQNKKEGVKKSKQRELLGTYMHGKSADLGCGNGKCDDSQIGVDIYPYPCVDRLHDTSDLWFFEDEELDSISASHHLEHLADPKKVLKEWDRVLKPGGTMAIIVPNGDFKGGKTIREESHKHALTFNILRQLFKNVLGYKIIELKHIDFLPQPEKVILLVARKRICE